MHASSVQTCAGSWRSTRHGWIWPRHTEGRQNHSTCSASICDEKAISQQSHFLEGRHHCKYCINCWQMKRTQWIVIIKVKITCDWGASSKLKRWEREMPGDGDPRHPTIHFCKGMPCSKQATKLILRQSCATISTMSSNRRRKLATMILCKAHFYLYENHVCSKFLTQSFDLKNDLQVSVRKAMWNKLWPHDKLEYNEPSLFQKSLGSKANRRNSIAWYLKGLEELPSDQMPDKSKPRLPFFQKRQVSHGFMEEYQNLFDNTPLSLLYFEEIWDQYCTSVKVLKGYNFQRCSPCEEMDTELRRAADMNSDTTEINAKMSRHIKPVQRGDWDVT